MYRRIRIGFLLLVITQGFHSIEEYYGKLWEVLPPARYLSRLFVPNRQLGFAIINMGLFLFGLLSWILATRNHKISYRGLIWFWIGIELLNGIGHPVLALREKAYFPGLVTAPILLILSVYLGKQLLLHSPSEHR